ncbi:transglycosylase SLT domain-containing protein, partial [Candidatus Poribacteria bacterium]|nr:transglycosylase SLT domain-containing protein [Candidatus Poribacteria bacterium]
DPLLVLALMLEESRYDPDAVSYVGARGLTQIMPSTGREIAGRISINPFFTEMLFQPELNIKMGTWYLGSIARRFKKRVQDNLGNNHSHITKSDRDYVAMMLAVGAYNGGESRVKRWMAKYGIQDIDEFVENIPIYETRRYIKKVFDSYEMYKAIYKD